MTLGYVPSACPFYTMILLRLLVWKGTTLGGVRNWGLKDLTWSMDCGGTLKKNLENMLFYGIQEEAW